MDLMTRRRALLALVESGVIDTSPRISEYGVYWARGNDNVKTQDTAWCITDWYSFDPQYNGVVSIYGYVGNDGNTHTFRYNGVRTDQSTFSDWYFFGTASRRGIGGTNVLLASITFSIELSKINDVYCYIEETGQIFFAGRNTPYYGYTNINDMPTGT